MTLKLWSKKLCALARSSSMQHREKNQGAVGENLHKNFPVRKSLGCGPLHNENGAGGVYHIGDTCSKKV